MQGSRVLREQSAKGAGEQIAGEQSTEGAGE